MNGDGHNDYEYKNVRHPYLALLDDDRISDSAKITLIAIQRIVDEERPLTITKIAKERDKSPFEIKRQISEIEDTGFVVMQNKGGRSRRNRLRRF